VKYHGAENIVSGIVYSILGCLLLTVLTYRPSDYTIKTQPIVWTTPRNQKLTKVYVQSNTKKQLTVHIRETGLHKQQVVKWRLNVCVTGVKCKGGDSHQKNNNIRGSTVVCSDIHSTVQVLTTHCCNQFGDLCSL